MTVIRFALVGLLNTLIGFAVILIGLRIGLGDYAANALGYGVGLGVSYALNRNWTFRAGQPASLREFGRFALAFAVAYSANLSVVAAGRAMGMIGQPLVHFAGLGLYTVLFFVMSRLFVFGTADPLWRHQGGLAHVRKFAPEAALGLAAITACLALSGIPLTHDVVWQFWVARQMLHGAALYRDIIEINPPLWFWSAIPLQYGGEVLGVSPDRLLVPLVTLAGALSAAAVGNIAGPYPPLRRAAIMLLAFWLSVIAPIYDFGQREQLSLICALPYVALIAARWSGRPPGWPAALLIGVVAAYGFALKHYFVIVPISLELWLFLRQRRTGWTPIRPETVALAIGAALYAFAVVWWAPDFLTRMVPLVEAAYHGYESPWGSILARPWTLFWLIIAIFFVAHRRELREQADPQVTALLIAAAGFALAYFLQRKGWLYHSVPATALLTLALGIFAGAKGLRRARSIALVAAILVLPLTMPLRTGTYHNFFRSSIDSVLATVPRGEAVLIAATDPMWGWPTVRDHGLVWRSRYYAYWMLPAIAHAEIVGPNSTALRQIARDLQAEAVQELRCGRPALVLFERQRSYLYQPASFDLRGFFLRDPAMRDILAQHYRLEAGSPELFVYRRVGDFPAAPAATCPRLS